MEFVTTVGRYTFPNGPTGVPKADDPVLPDDDSVHWELKGTCAADGLLFWTWERGFNKRQ